MSQAEFLLWQLIPCSLESAHGEGMQTHQVNVRCGGIAPSMLQKQKERKEKGNISRTSKTCMCSVCFRMVCLVDPRRPRPCLVLPWTKKNHPRDSQQEERCSTWDIMLDQARSARGKSRGQSRIRPCPRWSLVIEHDITHGTAFFSPRISRMVLFLSRVVDPKIARPLSGRS